MRAFLKYQILFVAAFMLLGVNAVNAQAATDKLYGFVQVIVPGAAASAKKMTDDAGNVINRAPTEVRYKYFIYLTTAAKTKIYPIEMWINGKAFSADVQTVTATPVQHTSHLVPGRPQKTILVPKTTQKVTQLLPTPLMAEKSTAKARELAKSNALVVVYKQGGKTYYKTLKELGELNASGLQ